MPKAHVGGLVLQVEASPRDAGMSAERLRAIQDMLAERVAAGEIPGAVALVWRGGRVVWVATAGRAAVDSIFRIYSMTKPLTSAAAMALAEDGLLDLASPIGKYLPELASLKVAAGAGAPGQETVPAGRPVTVCDLLCHTSGFVGGYHGSAMVSRAYRQGNVIPFDHTREMAEEYTCEKLVSALAGIPLAHQPGTVWEYGRSADVLGRLLEVAAGQTLDVILRERVLAPLGMHDTGLFVPAGSAHRIVRPLASFTPGTELVSFTRLPAFRSGGSGCYSTAADYLGFARMLLSEGQAEGRRVLSRESVRLMTSDHLGPLAGSGPDYIPGPGYGFGFGLAVRLPPRRGAGDIWWLGRAATSFFIDPGEDLIGILLTQRYWEARSYQAWFKGLVYQAITG